MDANRQQSSESINTREDKSSATEQRENAEQNAGDSSTTYQQLDPVAKQRTDYEFSKYTAALEKFNEVRYRWASIIEALVVSDYDVSAWYNDKELDEILDWKSDYDLNEAQKAAVAKERFALNEARRQAKLDLRLSRKNRTLVRK